MRTFAIVNRKGGVGKTTTAVNLAYVLATSCHLRVLLVDADGQANATQILLPRGEYDGLGALMRGMAICYDELVVHTDVEGLDVLPASEDLWALDLEAAGGEGGRSYRTLRDMREAVEEDGAYDVMVIDCPPNLSAACVSAILASDAVIIPVLSDACSATGVADLMEQIDSLRYIRPEIRVAGVLVTNLMGDGVIVSTPTGSTAYSMSAGGPIVEPTSRDIIVTPVCAHQLSTRSMVLAPERLVTVQLPRGSRKHLYLAVDGGKALRITGTERVEISCARQSTRLIRLTERNFYQIIYQKLGGYEL